MCSFFHLTLLFSNLSFVSGQKVTVVVTVVCIDLLNFPHHYFNTLIHWCQKPVSSSVNNKVLKFHVIITTVTTVFSWWLDVDRKQQHASL